MRYRPGDGALCIGGSCGPEDTFAQESARLGSSNCCCGGCARDGCACNNLWPPLVVETLSLRCVQSRGSEMLFLVLLECRGGRTWPKPPVELAIRMVALAVRSMASRHASAGGHLSIRSAKTEVAARTVKSTSSIVCEAC